MKSCVKKFCLLTLFLNLTLALNAVSFQTLEQIIRPLQTTASPFPYAIKIHLLPGTQADENVLLCFHGMGGNYQIAEIIRKNAAIDDHLISFNFPDADMRPSTFDPMEARFGTIEEILLPIFLMNQLVKYGNLDNLSLYGFSAGGGAVVNVLAVLNSTQYEKELNKIGVTEKEKKAILAAIQKGVILLDSPLKSIEEISSFRGHDLELKFFDYQYKKNGFVPIDSLNKLKGLSLNVLLFFQKPDMVISNRDDALFIERLRSANQGTTCVITANDGGHGIFHPSLWNAYRNFLKTGTCN